MKKLYTAPKMTVHGNVEEITQVIGKSTAQDFFYLNGNVVSPDTIGFSDGSVDLEIIIRPRA